MFRSAGKPIDFLPSPEEIIRFLGKVEVMDLPGTKSHGCWKWKAGGTGDYGTFYLRGKNQRAHRASFQIFVGPLEIGEDVHHNCRNEWCVNPRHLEAITHESHGCESADTQINDMVHVSFFGGPLDGEERRFIEIPEVIELRGYGQVDTYRWDEDLLEMAYHGFRRVTKRR